MATPKRRPAPARGETTPVTRAVPFTKLRALLGKPLDDAAATRVLASAGTVFVPTISRGHLIVARDAGFDLLLSPRDGKRGAALVVSSVTLYRDGITTSGCPPRARKDYVHRQYSDPPFALGFDVRAELLKRLAAPRETWLWGTGRVAVKAPLVSYDEWLLDGLVVQAHYTAGVDTPASSPDATVEHIDISPP